MESITPPSLDFTASERGLMTPIDQSHALLRDRDAAPRRAFVQRRGLWEACLLGFLALGLCIALAVPGVFCTQGILMSAQPAEVVWSTGEASAFAMLASLLILRRILTFPLLRTGTFVVLTVAVIFVLAGITLKVFRVNFSGPQFFLCSLILIVMIEAFLTLKRRREAPRLALFPGVNAVDVNALLGNRRAQFRPLTAVPSSLDTYDGVIADFRQTFPAEWERCMAEAALRGLPIFHVKLFKEMMSGRVDVEHMWENATLGMHPALIYPQIKRVFDVAAAICLLPIVLPVIVVLGIVVRLQTAGPALFCQDRVGYGGATFKIYKLRTMSVDAGRMGEAFTQNADPRVTPLGSFLRHYRIDELPQIFNIIKGDMSWIGPRPEAQVLAEWYEREIPFYAYRHVVKPGITGWAQVNQGNVAKVDAAKRKLEYDFYYIKHFSIWLDIIIVVKTIRTIITGFGAR